VPCHTLKLRLGKKNIYPGEAQKIIDKQTVVGVITTGTISPDAKKRFDQAGIAWAEKVPKVNLGNLKLRRKDNVRHFLFQRMVV
jgi:glycine cleavage system aminomethyltransferase T